jgi:hypothetical protein
MGVEIQQFQGLVALDSAALQMGTHWQLLEALVVGFGAKFLERIWIEYQRLTRNR